MVARQGAILAIMLLANLPRATATSLGIGIMHNFPLDIFPTLFGIMYMVHLTNRWFSNRAQKEWAEKHRQISTGYICEVRSHFSSGCSFQHRLTRPVPSTSGMPQRGTEASYIRNRERQYHKKLFGVYRGNGSGEQLLASSDKASQEGTHPNIVLDDKELYDHRPAGWWAGGVFYTAQQWAEWEADKAASAVHDGHHQQQGGDVEHLIEEAIGGLFPMHPELQHEHDINVEDSIIDENHGARPKQGPRSKAMPKPRPPSTSPPKRRQYGEVETVPSLPKRPPATPLSARRGGNSAEYDFNNKHSRRESRERRGRKRRNIRERRDSRERDDTLRGVWRDDQHDPHASSSATTSQAVLRILTRTIQDLATAGSRST